MAFLLRISDMKWPCSRAELEADNPATWFPPDLEDAQPLEQFGYILPQISIPEEHDPTAFQAQEIRPVEVDGVWIQQWELVPIEPSPPEPDWRQFRAALRDENGFRQAFTMAMMADPMASVSLALGLERFRMTGDYYDFLAALLVAMQALPPAQSAHLGAEMFQLATRCHIPQDFNNSLQAALSRNSA